ncbi:hypothetical protein DPM19_12925 [Actinomadura craniellae]|uniref:DUF7144 domain-containing protein n=1 Tax=Actinomadura craniellae TaxID=2231787 RepID=A0A365H6E7_9ACTN|nr:hypothetical protein [Actinomadura craniellae]RAY14657.1 hypothetical protein DPM19_12925 [Actinomadura craniellae]
MATSSSTRRPTTSGWLSFAAIIFLLIGIYNVINGLVGIFKKAYYVVTGNEVLIFNFTAWGWTWLIVGIIQLVIAWGLFTGQTWARMAAIVLAALVAIGHLLFLAAFPLWSIVTIALCVLVIYALTVPSNHHTAAV